MMTLMGAFAGMFFKKASVDLKIKSLLSNYNLYVGAFIYTISSLINIYILRFLDYSTVLPLTSLTYVWTMVIAKCILKENVNIEKFLGVVFIILGSMVISWS